MIIRPLLQSFLRNQSPIENSKYQIEEYRNNKIPSPDNQIKSNFCHGISINLIKLGSAASIRDQFTPVINFCSSVINAAQKKIR